MYTTYDFTNFNYTDSLINIHKNSIFYRGIRDIESINNLNILRNNVPIYLSSKDSAKQYSSNNPNNIYSICITDDIKVFDLGTGETNTVVSGVSMNQDPHWCDATATN